MIQGDGCNAVCEMPERVEAKREGARSLETGAHGAVFSNKNSKFALSWDFGDGGQQALDGLTFWIGPVFGSSVCPLWIFEGGASGSHSGPEMQKLSEKKRAQRAHQ